jgi:hypothetical protein
MALITISKFTAKGTHGGEYVTEIQRADDGSFFALWQQPLEHGKPEDHVVLDEISARALFFALKAHFE